MRLCWYSFGTENLSNICKKRAKREPDEEGR